MKYIQLDAHVNSFHVHYRYIVQNPIKFFKFKDVTP